MNKIIKKLVVVGLIASVMSLPATVGALDSEDQTVNVTTGDIVEIEKKACELTEILGEDNIYPEVYKAANRRILAGENDKDIRGTIESEFIKTESLYWLACVQGFGMTESQLKDRMNQEVSVAKSADNYAEYAVACEDNDISFYDFMVGDVTYYEKIFVTDNMYTQYYEGYVNGNNEFNGVEFNSWESLWQGIEMYAVNEYKKTASCEILLRGIDISFDNLDVADDIIELRGEDAMHAASQSNDSNPEYSLSVDDENIEIVEMLKETTNVYSNLEYMYVSIEQR